MVPRLAAVSSLSGSDRIVQGFSWKWSKKSCKKASHRKARAWLWKGEYLIPGTPIPVERCDAPVLLIQGLKDRLWKAKRSKRLERRLKAAGKYVETFYMADEGHILSVLAVNRVTSETGRLPRQSNTVRSLPEQREHWQRCRLEAATK
jgi:pimeloyl-ACP methyl ester carboxylesterase